jgi:hypothetical protein
LAPTSFQKEQNPKGVRQPTANSDVMRLSPNMAVDRMRQGA